MHSQFSLRRRVEFSETDMAGIVHFSNFFRYMEIAEAAFYRSLGLTIVDPASGIGWPRVHAECDYHRPLLFEEEFDIHLAVEEVRTRSLRFRFKFVKISDGGNIVAARARIATVCVKKKPDGGLEASPIPLAFREKVSAAPADMLAA
ncbi:MAG: acyl-CoA thioesterase, partial [Verrucomicrobia bacterium]|nr:acyl-CoA thioesterase [Verrucomicrobiota bacterium]